VCFVRFKLSQNILTKRWTKRIDGVPGEGPDVLFPVGARRITGLDDAASEHHQQYVLQRFGDSFRQKFAVTSVHVHFDIIKNPQPQAIEIGEGRHVGQVL